MRGILCPSAATSRIWKGFSQLDETLLFVFLASLCILHMRFPFLKLLDRTFVLYRLAARSLHAISQILLLSRSLFIKSCPTEWFSWFRDKLKSCLRREGLPTSTGIMASVLYVRLSPVLRFGACNGTPIILLSTLQSTIPSLCQATSLICWGWSCSLPQPAHWFGGVRPSLLLTLCRGPHKRIWVLSQWIISRYRLWWCVKLRTDTQCFSTRKLGHS